MELWITGYSSLAEEQRLDLRLWQQHAVKLQSAQYRGSRGAPAALGHHAQYFQWLPSGTKDGHLQAPSPKSGKASDSLALVWKGLG